MKHIILMLVAALMLVASPADAREFREKSAIKTPLENDAALQADDKSGGPVGAPTVSLDQEFIRRSIEKLMASWGTGDIENYLGDRFPNRSELVNALNDHVPFDARLEVKSIRAIKVIGQKTRQGDDGRPLLVSVVSAEVETDVHYQDARIGNTRLRGTGEYLFELTSRSKS